VHNNYTNYYLFDANFTNFNKICFLVYAIYKFKSCKFKNQILACTGNWLPFALAAVERVINQTVA